MSRWMIRRCMAAYDSRSREKVVPLSLTEERSLGAARVWSKCFAPAASGFRFWKFAIRCCRHRGFGFFSGLGLAGQRWNRNLFRDPTGNDDKAGMGDHTMFGAYGQVFDMPVAVEVFHDF